MKSDFLLAITQLSAEKNLPTEVVLSTVEAALVSAYRKDNFSPNQEVSVKINPTSGKVQVWAGKTVVEKPSDATIEISITDARKINPEVELGETVMVESTPSNAGRIAAQTAKQVILQRLHEAEHTAIHRLVVFFRQTFLPGNQRTQVMYIIDEPFPGFDSRTMFM